MNSRSERRYLDLSTETSCALGHSPMSYLDRAAAFRKAVDSVFKGDVPKVDPEGLKRIVEEYCKNSTACAPLPLMTREMGLSLKS